MTNPNTANNGDAKPDKPDTRMPVTVHCVDEEIIEWLKWRERRKSMP